MRAMTRKIARTRSCFVTLASLPKTIGMKPIITTAPPFPEALLPLDDDNTRPAPARISPTKRTIVPRNMIVWSDVAHVLPF